MPQIFKFGGYIIFFWSNENKPTEPIHVHIAERNPKANSTKVWITKRGRTLVCNNNSQIPSKDLRHIGCKSLVCLILGQLQVRSVRNAYKCNGREVL